MHAPASRLASAITLLFLAGGGFVVVFAVVAVVRDAHDDAAWAAILLGAGLAVWGLWFRGLTDDDETSEPRGRRQRDRTGTAATIAVLVGGSYWMLRGPLDRGVSEALVVTVIVMALLAVNRSVDARTRRRRRDGPPRL